LTQDIEYGDPMRIMLELIWGEGYMVPGGEGNVDNLVRGLDIRDKRVLDIGSGLGGPAFHLAKTYGASVLGIDIEPQLIEHSTSRAKELNLDRQAKFMVVEPGPMKLPDASFDLALSSGALTQTEDKLGLLREAFRVLRPGGVFSCYDWMKCEGEYSEEMLYFFQIEGITYALETPDRHKELLAEVGFADISVEDRSVWYRQRVKEESQKVSSELYPKMLELLGQTDAEHFVENWRALTVVCDKGELLQVYSRGRKPA
jgi:phosphoethanolamine N-methyltransferase